MSEQDWTELAREPLCEHCMAIMNARAALPRVSGQRESLPRAGRNGQVWGGAEIAVALRDDLTARQAAAMLGRTVYAVQHRRAMHAKDSQ